MSGVDVLIFSKDRPAQLELLLRSIDTFAAGIYSSVCVLWTCSSRVFEPGYRLLAEEHPAVRFGAERDFHIDTREWLHQAGEIVSFLVDDDVFYRDATPPQVLPWSFRGGDYWYPFSVDGNVYDAEHITALLYRIPFREPTGLEAHGHEMRRRLPFTSVHPCRPPCLVGIPANRVSTRSGMPHMGVDPVELNRRFLAGERLEIPAVPDGVDLAPHVNLELGWTAAVSVG